MKRDLYAEVSARIVAELEAGAAPWVVSPKSLLRSRAPSGTVRASLASGIKRIDRRWRNPAVLKGEHLSDVNMKGDFGSCSRCSRRNERSSSPRIGWVLGYPA